MAKDNFTNEEVTAITESIKSAELNTSGEIVLHIESKCKGDVLLRSQALFRQLGVEKTELRNGVLFYLAVDDKKFAILGDSGIDKATPTDFWDTIKDTMLEDFKMNKLSNGLIKGIGMAGDALKNYFPYQQDDVNELNDEISFGE